MKKIKKAIKYILMRLHEFILCVREFKSGGKLKGSAYNSYVDSGMLVNVHSVEKGLGLKNSAPGHSSSLVLRLLDKLLLYCDDVNKIHCFSYKETVRVIMEYIDFQKKYDVTKFAQFPKIEEKYNKLVKILGNDYINSVRIELSAGTKLYQKEDLLSASNFDFKEFVRTRHSVRSFTDELIDSDIISEAVLIANMAPSACNRQPNNVYFSNKKAIVDKIDALITGSIGFKGETHNFIVLTTDRSFFSNEEQFQWYINGGIYLSYLSLALHSLGIGHCIMQWKAFYKTETELKELLGITTHEAIIAVISCGFYQQETKCICAQRKDVQETLHIV